MVQDDLTSVQREENSVCLLKPHKKTVLLVDDRAVNRKILGKLLQSDYDLLEAENGVEAFRVLKEYGDTVALILLDIRMPVMDGYAFLDKIQQDAQLSQIPIIVETSSGSPEEEVKALSAGASDFVTKPYNLQIVRHRVASIIRLRESASMINLLERDRVTSLYSREFFYRYAEQILKDTPTQHYDILCTNIENFKLVNERYGTSVGDTILRTLGVAWSSTCQKNELCGRISADKFVRLREHRENESEEAFKAELNRWMPSLPIPNIVVKFGIYRKVDPTLSISTMCNRAALAVEEIKGKYGRVLSEYSDTIHRRLLAEQKILDEMETALQQKQFVVYYQPKHNLQTGALSGAEALVRWEHPANGIISPGMFIPLFERNGFIQQLDAYVWERTCADLENWRTLGLPLVPVSVNISRINFALPDLAEQVKDKTSRHGIPPELLHLEVTESAYTENPREIIEKVQILRRMGFKIEMDDFGSGYSSLNTLNELPVDILKFDMQFVQQKDTLQKKSILPFIISLAQWLQLDTIAEGVETEEQMMQLRGMGCQYVQGYYYAKPMPERDFQLYLESFAAGHDA